MDLSRYFKDAIIQTRIVLSPRQRIATFGDTKLRYFFLSEIEGYKDRSRLRQGIVTAERPRIITMEVAQERFAGFDGDARKFGEWLSQQYGESFRALEYHFKNEEHSPNVKHQPAKVLSEQILNRLTDSERNQSLIALGPDKAWQISLMKFIIDECGASFHGNVKDLEQHGFFDTPEEMQRKKKQMIEGLFRKCRADRSYLPVLGRKLQESGLFDEYQDEFFKLVG